LLLQDQLVQQIRYFSALLIIMLFMTHISKLTCNLWKFFT